MTALETLAVVGFGNAISAAVLGWLAFYFGRTLHGGRVPMIERVARVSEPALPAELCSYTRKLTALWCVYFIVAAVAVVSAELPYLLTGGCVWLGVIALFVGEHRLRPVLFPGQAFPPLIQQVKDTVSVWRRTQ